MGGFLPGRCPSSLFGRCRCPMTGHRQSLHALRGNIIRRKILFRSLDKISRRSAAPRPTESTRDFQDLPQRTRFVPGIHSIPPDLVYHSVLMTIY